MYKERNIAYLPTLNTQIMMKNYLIWSDILRYSIDNLKAKKKKKP